MATWTKTSIAIALAFTAAAVAIDADPGQELPLAGIHFKKGQQPARKAQSPLLVYHGGPVMHGTHVQPILWGTSWSDPAFVADKFTGLTAFYTGVGDSDYANTNTEYTDPSGPVNSGVIFDGIITDLSPAPKSGSKTTPILAEVCAAVGNNVVSDGYYPVYVDQPSGKAPFCAWHSRGTCPNGTTVQIGFFFNLDGDPGCDPRDTSGRHSQGLAALANVSGHELSEMLTDPHLNAWFDGSGQENADKCAWSFGTPLLTFLNGSQWKIQGNWSNAAFNASTGFANSSGQPGCLDGGNFK